MNVLVWSRLLLFESNKINFSEDEAHIMGGGGGTMNVGIIRLRLYIFTFSKQSFNESLEFCNRS